MIAFGPTIATASAEETFRIGLQLGRILIHPCVIVFNGELGAGKTTLIRGIASALGADEREVCSPTFTYLNIYQGQTTIYHFDLYRIPSEQEFIAAGFEEFLHAGGVCCIEWPDKIPSLLSVQEKGREYRKRLKNREFDKEAPQNSGLERATIVRAQGASEGQNFEEKPTQSKTDSSSAFGIYSISINHAGENLREITIT
jgi:tRNA threonylcarbamoyladenosine biosynthesis protein TsaE